ncbi:MAG: sulfate permease [bacterium]|nr:sulfate permease [bacterium]
MTSVRRNFIAGTTTAVILIPQSMAYALVAGMPAYHGLYASLLPLVAYTFIGRSRQLAIGPGALDALLVGTALSGVAAVTQENYTGVAMILALEVAAIQIVLAALRAGFLVNYLSQPVLSGFTSAAAIIIGTGQLPNLLGYASDDARHPVDMAIAFARHVAEFHPITAAIGVASLLILIVLKRVWKSFPGALAVVLVGTVIVAGLGLDQSGVRVLGEIPRGLPVIALPPAMGLDVLVQLFPGALTIALTGYLAMISIARTFADRNGYEISPDRELYAAGVVNATAGISQGFPLAASFSRSAVMAAAGSTSRFALLFTAGWVLLTLVFITDYLYYLPGAVLAAIIIQGVSGLVDLKTVRRLWRVKRIDMVLLIITFVATLTLGVEPGILSGIACSLAVFVYSTSRPHTAVLGRLDDSIHFRNINNYENARTIPGIKILRFDSQMYFGNVSFFKDMMRGLEDDPDLQAVIIDGCSLNQIDSSADSTLHAIADRLRSQKIDLYFASLKMPVLSVMRASGLYDKLGPDRFYFDVDEAVRACQAMSKKSGAPN